jgi:ubiquinone/menaquinone biosynthesis C-methylase UbiE
MIDFGAQAGDYARYRLGHDAAFFDRLATYGVGLSGQRIVDMGTGTGLFARSLSQRGCSVIGIDSSEPLLTEAKKLNGAERCNVEYQLGLAEDTGLPPSTFDCVTAATCWHWFDRAAAAREARRLLTEGGKLVIAALDWLLLPDNVVEATLEVTGRHQTAPHSGPYTFLYPEWTSDLVEAGFRAWDVFVYTTALTYSHEAWCGRVRASADIANLDEEKVAQFTADLKSVLARKFPADPLQVEHKVFCLIARTQ